MTSYIISKWNTRGCHERICSKKSIFEISFAQKITFSQSGISVDMRNVGAAIPVAEEPERLPKLGAGRRRR